MSKVTIDVDVANPQIRSVCLGHRGEDGKDGLKILVGTRGSEIVEFNISSKSDEVGGGRYNNSRSFQG